MKQNLIATALRSSVFLALLHVSNAIEVAEEQMSDSRHLQVDFAQVKKTPPSSVTWFRLFLFQAIVGVLLFERAWYQTRRFRDGDDERDSHYPELRRTDAKKWAKWKFYPGAIFVLVPRALLNAICISFLALSIKLLCIGHDLDKGPIPDGCRKRCIRAVYFLTCSQGLWSAGMGLKRVHHDELDYSEYLGPNYKEGYADVKKASTIVCNHCSWLDCLVLICEVCPGFCPTIGFKNVPIFNTTIEALDSFYIDRGSDHAAKDRIVKSIVDRQMLIEETGRYAKLCIFPEGGATNNTALLKFKRGAFVGEKRVSPMILKYKYDGFSPAFDVIDFLPLATLSYCWRGLTCEVHYLPDFEPNNYLFETHKDKGKHRWEIYAWAVRDIMAKAGNFELSDCTLAQKLAYY